MPTPTTRAFRQSLPDGPNGEQRPIRSNFPSGLGMNKQYDPKPGIKPLAPSADPDAAPVASGAAPSVPAGPSAVTPDQMRERAARMARSGTPNAGGQISTEVAPGVTAVQRYAPSPAASLSPNRPNLGGTMTRGGVVTRVPPSPSTAPVASPTTVNAQQTESADPLTGDGNAQPGGTTDSVNPASALGFNRRGSAVPRGSDAAPDSSTIGGSGIYARKFNSPKSAGLYGDYIKRLFPT